jgi:hypothetical protein
LNYRVTFGMVAPAASMSMAFKTVVQNNLLQVFAPPLPLLSFYPYSHTNFCIHDDAMMGPRRCTRACFTEQLCLSQLHLKQCRSHTLSCTRRMLSTAHIENTRCLTRITTHQPTKSLFIHPTASRSTYSSGCPTFDLGKGVYITRGKKQSWIETSKAL